MPTKRFVILDRDGTINEEVGHLSRPDQVRLIAGAAAGLRRLREQGVGIIVVTNQSVIGQGMINQSELDEIHNRLKALLKREDVTLDGIYVCPHMPEDNCNCRKPKTGLLEQASRDFGFNLAGSIVIGDKVSDIELGKRAGATTILVRTGYGDQYQRGEVQPDYIAADLENAASLIEAILSGNDPGLGRECG